MARPGHGRSRSECDPRPAADENWRRWFNELQRVSTSPANAVRLQRAIGELDERALLAQVAAPTLVLHVRDDAMVVVAQHVHAEPTPPSERRPGLPAALDKLILRPLAKDPAARPESAAEVRDELAGGLLECCSTAAALSPESSPIGSPPAA